jgi:hypothetical protein
MLDHIADAASQLDRIHDPRVPPPDDDSSRAWIDYAVDHLQRGGFSASGWTDDDFETSRSSMIAEERDAAMTPVNVP